MHTPAHALNAGDVVLTNNSTDARTVATNQTTSVDDYALTTLTFADGTSLLCDPNTTLPKIWPITTDNPL